MSASESPASEVCVTELDRIAKKKVKDLRYYYKNRERILAAQMVQRREDPEFQERQRVKEEAVASAQAEKEARQAEKERLRLEHQAEREHQMAAKKEANSAINQEKRRLEQEEKMKQRQEAQRKRKEDKVKEKALALGLCFPPAESFSGDPTQ